MRLHERKPGENVLPERKEFFSSSASGEHMLHFFRESGIWKGNCRQDRRHDCV